MDLSTQDRECNPDAKGRVQFASDVLSEESRFMKAIFAAISELAPRPDMTKTVVELANCGQWISDNLNCKR